jgi:UDP-3-O-[3-hydroxymyristoyl] glucosamine N-acyltransferase
MSTRTLSELAELCGAVLDGDGALAIDGPASLLDAGPREISFLANPRYQSQLATTRAAAVLVTPEVRETRPGLALLRCADPNAAFTRIVRAFAGDEALPRPGLDPRAVLDPTAEIASEVSIGPWCVVGAGARIGARSVLLSGVQVGAGAVIGEASVLHAGVVLYPRTVLGARCVLHAGVVIGADGFGYEPPREGRGWTKIPHCGSVELEDDVEIGANTTIDRARFGKTRIGRGVKIDNLVHVGHNVSIGENALVVAQAGISGSARIGAGAVLGGQAGINGHIEIGAGARIAAQAGVFGDVPPGEDWLGFPARPRAEALRTLAHTQRIPKLQERLRELEQQVQELAALIDAPAGAGTRNRPSEENEA